MEKTKWIYAGKCWVDSGTIILGDPCYLIGNKWIEQDYEKEVCSEWGNFKQIRDKIVLVSSGYGDGEYPVFVKIKDNRVKEVKIKFF